MSLNRLTPDQIKFYHEDGYLTGLPSIYDAPGVAGLNEGIQHILALLEPGERPLEIREWHQNSTFLFDICMNEQILNYVEDLIGPDFYMWASSFFIKDPHSPETVDWHQDSYYWPLTPPESLTVWLAFSDSDEENGAMRVIPGSHKGGIIQHTQDADKNSVLTLRCESADYTDDTAVFMNLKAGQISIHDDKIIHGSLGNNSSRPRIGFTIRYSKTNVKCDLAVNPNFKTYHCRGVDRFNHNPRGPIPAQKYGRIWQDYRNVETELADT
ncbi:MAG: phytanoyl-CoA dioxygenase family protein [Candidatus Hydrogenedentes bacterium]|nr:phytanoyl-CoA dioxygenase family protein [Candidatus Hydrogenedentota bacterium]